MIMNTKNYILKIIAIGLLTFALVFLLVSHADAQNRKPIAINDTVYIDRECCCPVKPFNILQNDSDPDGNPIKVLRYTHNGINYTPRISSRELTGLGTISIQGNGTLIIQPTDTGRITYTISDGKRGTATATVVFIKSRLVVQQSAVDAIDTLYTLKNTELTATLAGCTDVYEYFTNGLTYGTMEIAYTGNGWFTITTNGVVKFKPEDNFTGQLKVIRIETVLQTRELLIIVR